MKRLLLVFVFAGCAVGPNYQKPVVPVPDRLYGGYNFETSDDLSWFDGFGDDVLRSLVAEALRSGHDARIAAARVEEARARYGIAGAARFPEVDYDLRGGYGRQNGETGAAVAANVGAFWEIDLWGRIRRLNEAARAQYLSTEEGERAIRLALASEVASAYFDLRELDEERRILMRTYDAFRATYNLFDARLRGGTASGLETARAEALMANASAQLALIEGERYAAENRLNVLLGRVPGPIHRGADVPVPPSIPAALPATILLRRPDVRAAEQSLIAANANIGVATAAFYPALSLTGLLGVQSAELSSLFSDGRTWSVQASLLGPIFNAGRLRNQRRVAVAQFEAALAQYEQSVTRALADVSTSLITFETVTLAEASRRRAVDANQEAVRLATLRYESGLSAYFEVLDAMQQLYTAETALARTQRDRLIALVKVYRAMGGGWEDLTPSPVSSRTPSN